MSYSNDIKTLLDIQDKNITIEKNIQIKKHREKICRQRSVTRKKVLVKRGMMYEEKWGEIVIDWLMEDFAFKKKLRRKTQPYLNRYRNCDFPVLIELFVTLSKNGKIKC